MKMLAAKFLIVALSVFSSFAYAGNIYGYLVVSKDGYSLDKNVTTDPRNDLLDNWARGQVGGRPAVRGARGHVKINLSTLQPAANDGLKNTSCRSDTHWQPSWAPCSVYENTEDHFIIVGRRSDNYSELSFNFYDFNRAVKDALKQAGFNDFAGAGKEAWTKRVADVSNALEQNNAAEKQAIDALEAKIRNAEFEMNRFQPLITYSSFKYKKKSATHPTLFLDLKTYSEEQEADRQSFAKTTLEQFSQYFEPLKADAERLYPGLLAQQKAEALAREKAERAAQAERERQEKIAAAEMKKQQAVEAKRVTVFRVSIKIETETNCGPVIGVRGNLVQVSSPVAGYGNEHWVRRNELFPSGYGCWWLNGNYAGTERP